MSPARLPADRDPIRPAGVATVRVIIDGEAVDGLVGQTIAGVLLASGRDAWRRTSLAGEPRGVFCGIGVCFDCIVTVNEERDVRACLRRAVDGDEITVQHDALPEHAQSQRAQSERARTGGAP